MGYLINPSPQTHRHTSKKQPQSVNYETEFTEERKAAQFDSSEAQLRSSD